MPAPLPVEPRGAPKRELTLLDSTSIIVGIIIGVGIYEASPLIARSVTGPAALLGVWLAGGAFALIGSLCYAELGTAYPAEGGDYVYLTRAFGRRMGFLFAWSELWVVRPGSIGAMAFVFADYADRLLASDGRQVVYAAGSVIALTAINVAGVTTGKWTQNVLTATKILGLLIVVMVGFFAAAEAARVPDAGEPVAAAPANWGFAMILILYAYGGWNDIAYVGAEVRRPEKNIVRALLLGTAAVTAIYLLINGAFLYALGFRGTQEAEAVAAGVAELGLGVWGARAVSGLVCISALGAINGMVFTGARIYYALGTEHALFAPLGVWSERFSTPLRSLVLQGLITLSVVIGFSQATDSSRSGFEKMVIFGLPLFWLFLLLVGVALFVLRWREPSRRGFFRVPGYPLTPLVFCASSLFMLYSSCKYAYDERSIEAMWAIGLFAVGLAVSCLSTRGGGGVTSR
jgi:amino acid transporter